MRSLVNNPSSKIIQNQREIKPLYQYKESYTLKLKFPKEIVINQIQVSRVKNQDPAIIQDLVIKVTSQRLARNLEEVINPD